MPEKDNQVPSDDSPAPADDGQPPIGKYKPEIVGLVPEEVGGPPMETDLGEIKASSELVVGDMVLRAHVLADGRRMIEQKGFDFLLEYLATGGTISGSDGKKIEEFLRGFSL